MHKMCQNSFLRLCSPYHHSSQHIYTFVSQESTNGLRYHDEEYESSSSCGTKDSVCMPTMAMRGVIEVLDQCLLEKFPNGRNTKVTTMSSPSQGDIEVFKITDPSDGDEYKAAKTSSLGSSRYPSVVIYI